VLIPAAAFGYLNPMLAAGAMAFSSVFVVSNSLRLRGVKTETLAVPKTRARQILEAAPAFAGFAVALILFVYFTLGRLQPAQVNGRNPQMAGPMTYSAQIAPKAPIVAGVPTLLDIQIVDQYGNQATAFEVSKFGKSVYYAFIAVAPRDLSSLYANPVVVNTIFVEAGVDPAGSQANGGASNMNVMGAPTAVISQVTPQAVEQQASEPEPVKIRPAVTFPKDGQYVVFVEVQPSGSDKVTFALPVTVGSGTLQAAALSSGESLTQSTSDLTATLKYDGVLKAGQPANINFDMVDAQGNLVSADIGLLSGSHLTLYILDEGLTTFLRPELVNTSNLQFSVNFPKPGKYKAWFEFLHAGHSQQLAFILDVK